MTAKGKGELKELIKDALFEFHDEVMAPGVERIVKESENRVTRELGARIDKVEQRLESVEEDISEIMTDVQYLKNDQNYRKEELDSQQEKQDKRLDRLEAAIELAG